MGFATHSYGTDWIPKYSENMWKMKQEDIQRRKDARDQAIAMQTQIGAPMTEGQKEYTTKRFGKEYTDAMGNVAKKVEGDINTAVQDKIYTRQTKSFDQGIKIAEMLSKMEGKPGMEAAFTQLMGRMQTAFKGAGIDVDFSAVIDQKEAAGAVRDAAFKKFSLLWDAAEKDPTDVNIKAATEALRQCKIANVPEISVYSVADLRKKQTSEKKQADDLKLFKEKEKYKEENKPVDPKKDILTLNGVGYQITTDANGGKVLSQLGGSPDAKPKNKIELTRAALNGDEESIQLLEEMARQDVKGAYGKGVAASEGKLAGLSAIMDVEGTAKAVLEGRETIENVKNTFGVPIQEQVRKEVLKQEPDFNFVQPRAIVSSLKSSLMQQQKNRGMMGSFVKNINGQVDKLENISEDIVKRVGVRALDVPLREINTRFIGSGHENVFAAYMKEISAEILKLSQGSTASVAQLPEENRKEWEKIHDVNLSMRELLIVLNGTREMANIRLGSVDDEINYTIESLGNVNKKSDAPVEKNKNITQAEYEKLPSGAEYWDDGVKYRKK